MCGVVVHIESILALLFTKITTVRVIYLTRDVYLLQWFLTVAQVQFQPQQRPWQVSRPDATLHSTVKCHVSHQFLKQHSF